MDRLAFLATGEKSVTIVHTANEEVQRRGLASGRDQRTVAGYGELVVRDAQDIEVRQRRDERLASRDGLMLW